MRLSNQFDIEWIAAEVFELTINLKTAKAIDLTVPPTLGIKRERSVMAPARRAASPRQGIKSTIRPARNRKHGGDCHAVIRAGVVPSRARVRAADKVNAAATD